MTHPRIGPIVLCLSLLLGIGLRVSAHDSEEHVNELPPDPQLEYPEYAPKAGDLILSRSDYADRLRGFWLGECIANWTGLRTEGLRKEAPFYTDKDWGTEDRKGRIEFVLEDENGVWGSDDDTDIEYVYQHAIDSKNKSVLSSDDIREAWLRHIDVQEDGNPRKLWVSNKSAWFLMKDNGMGPPETSMPKNNRRSGAIDAQLTTEVFGLFAPSRPDVALRMAHLPIRTTAYRDSEWISEFYVIMHSLALAADSQLTMKDRTVWLAEQASRRLPDGSVPALIYDFVKNDYEQNQDKSDWVTTRDAVYERYQVRRSDDYDFKGQYDAEINFAASLISLFYGQGDFKRTIKIGSLCGWDSDNPTATWGGLLGFMLGAQGVAAVFPETNLSDRYLISRTRINFPDHTPNREGEDTFELMAQRGVHIIDRVVIEEMGGGVDIDQDRWFIPNSQAEFSQAEF